MNKLNKIDPLDEARQRLERAAFEMPVLAAIAETYAPEKPLQGERLALCGHVTEATSVQVRTLRALGAEIAWCASSQSTTDDAVKGVMSGEIDLLTGHRGMSEEDLVAGVAKVLQHWEKGPTLVLDEGARLIEPLQARPGEIKLAAEKTPEGIQVVESLDLQFPVLMSDMSLGKRLVDNPHGTSQSLIQTVMNVGRCLLAGKTVLVCGYGRVGAGLAEKARGLGARVSIAEVRPTRALMATLSGFEVRPVNKALNEAQIVITVTGEPGSIGRDQFAHLRDGVLLVNGGHLSTEIDVSALKKAAKAEPFAEGIGGYRFEDGRCVYLMADGHIANLAVGAGNPNEVMDTTFASQVMALIIGRTDVPKPGLHALPEESEDHIARLIAQSLGVDVSALRARA